jgi:hypothetical protein
MKKPEKPSGVPQELSSLFDLSDGNTVIKFDSTDARTNSFKEGLFSILGKYDKGLLKLIQEAIELNERIRPYRKQFIEYIEDEELSDEWRYNVKAWIVAELGVLNSVERLKRELQAQSRLVENKMITKMNNYADRDQISNAIQVRTDKGKIKQLVDLFLKVTDDISTLGWVKIGPPTDDPYQAAAVFRHYNCSTVQEILFHQHNLLKKNNYCWDKGDFDNLVKVIKSVLHQESFEVENNAIRLNRLPIMLTELVGILKIDSFDFTDEYDMIKKFCNEGKDLFLLFQSFFDQIFQSLFNNDDSSHAVIEMLQMLDKQSDDSLTHELINLWIFKDMDVHHKFDFVNALFWFRDMYQQTGQEWYMRMATMMYEYVTDSGNFNDLFILDSNVFNEYIDFEHQYSNEKPNINELLDIIKRGYSRARFNWVVDQQSMTETIWNRPFQAIVDLDTHSMTVEVRVFFEKDDEKNNHQRITFAYDLTNEKAYFQFFDTDEVSKQTEESVYQFLLQVVMLKTIKAAIKIDENAKRREHSSVPIVQSVPKSGKTQRKIRQKPKKAQTVSEKEGIEEIDENFIAEDADIQPETIVEKLRQNHNPTYFYVTPKIAKLLKKPAKKGQKHNIRQAMDQFISDFNNGVLESNAGQPTQLKSIAGITVWCYRVGQVRFLAVPLANGEAVIFEADSRSDVYKVTSGFIRKVEQRAVEATESYLEYESLNNAESDM